MLRSSLCDYSDEYILVIGTITVGNTYNAANKKVICSNCAPFTNCIRRIDSMQADDAHDSNLLMLMYNLIECSDNYSRTSGILWQYCRDELALAANGVTTSFNADNATNDSFKIKEKITGQTGNNGKKILK